MKYEIQLNQAVIYYNTDNDTFIVPKTILGIYDGVYDYYDEYYELTDIDISKQTKLNKRYGEITVINKQTFIKELSDEVCTIMFREYNYGVDEVEKSHKKYLDNLINCIKEVFDLKNELNELNLDINKVKQLNNGLEVYRFE